MGALTETEVAMLAMERQWWATSGAKEAAICDQFGLTPVRYYQRLNRLIATEAALAVDAVTVNRLRRIRAYSQTVDGCG